jgi:hypothetical protein
MALVRKCDVVSRNGHDRRLRADSPAVVGLA